MPTATLGARVARYTDELVAFRRDVHAHPEVGRREVRTTALVRQRLERAGLAVDPLPGTGLLCDIGDPGLPAIVLRADIDALPLTEFSGVPFSSTVEGVAHACGHDVHTAVVLGAGLVLADLARGGALPGRVRLVFQPAEETNPGGALDVIAAGGLEGVRSAFAVHCDPHFDVGQVGLRVGPITSASDNIHVRLYGPGGHTSRPHLTADVVYALGTVLTQTPAVLSRRVDPRAGVNLTWGRISAGEVPNAIPRSGEVEGTLRCMDADAWEEAGRVVADAVHDLVRPYRVEADVTVSRGVPPVVNDATAVATMDGAARRELGDSAVCSTPQSLGGEDFAWFLQHVPGALARLGTRTPGGRTHDLHQGDLVVDERAISVGSRLLTSTALAAARVASRTGGLMTAG